MIIVVTEFKQENHEPWIAHLNSCHEERMCTIKYKSHSPTLKSILGITQIITKAYQVTKFKQIILICTMSMSELFYPTQKIRAQTFELYNVICNINFFRKKCFDLLTPYRGRGCVKWQKYASMLFYASFQVI